MNLVARDSKAPRQALHLARQAKYALFTTMLAGTCAVGGGFELQQRLLLRTHPRLRNCLIQWVQTSAIDRWTMPDRWPEPYASQFIVPGAWDVESVGDLEYYRTHSRNYRSAWQVFGEHRPYEESDQYRFLVRAIRDGTRHPEIEERGGTLAQVDAYFTDLARIFQEIKESGFRSQAELGLRDAVPDEVCVLVDREGRLVRAFGGNHRFAMAQILGVTRIPVRVLAVHERWARRWFDESRAGLVDALRQGLASLAETVQTDGDPPDPLPSSR